MVEIINLTSGSMGGVGRGGRACNWLLIQKMYDRPRKKSCAVKIKKKGMGEK